MLSSVTHGFPRQSPAIKILAVERMEEEAFPANFHCLGSKAGRTVSLPLPEKHENMPLGELKRRIEPVTGLPMIQRIFLQVWNLETIRDLWVDAAWSRVYLNRAIASS